MKRGKRLQLRYRGSSQETVQERELHHHRIRMLRESRGKRRHKPRNVPYVEKNSSAYTLGWRQADSEQPSHIAWTAGSEIRVWRMHPSQ